MNGNVNCIPRSRSKNLRKLVLLKSSVRRFGCFHTLLFRSASFFIKLFIFLILNDILHRFIIF
ncbi:hypothetical protein LINGRAHAP2_LOCUS10498 [Linum grandiflorum]